MSSDPSSLESDLRRLRAAALDDSLLERLDSCAAGQWTALSPAETAFERRLQGHAPAALSSSLAAALEATLAGVAFPGGVNIVRFPEPEISAPIRRHRRAWWSAAAAVVALAGAVSAFLLPLGSSDSKVPVVKQQTRPASPPSAARELIPAGFKRGLSEARDEGVIWRSNDRPHRVLKVVYQDQVTLKDRSGTTYQVLQPRVEYILVPANTD